jgi:hypothetical protein
VLNTCCSCITTCCSCITTCFLPAAAELPSAAYLQQLNHNLTTICSNWITTCCLPAAVCVLLKAIRLYVACAIFIVNTSL